MRTDSAEITVRLNKGGTPIAGEVQVTGGPRTTFTGWIGLLALLERAVERLTGARAANDLSVTHETGVEE